MKNIVMEEWEFKIFYWDRDYNTMPEVSENIIGDFTAARYKAFELRSIKKIDAVTYATKKSSVYYVTSNIDIKFKK